MANTPKRFSYRTQVGATQTYTEHDQLGTVGSGTRDYVEGHVIYEDFNSLNSVLLGADGSSPPNLEVIPDPGVLLRAGSTPQGVPLKSFYEQGDLLGARQFRAYTVLQGAASVALPALPLYSVVLIRLTQPTLSITLPEITAAMDGYTVRFVNQMTVLDGTAGLNVNLSTLANPSPERIGDETDFKYQLNKGQTVELMAVSSAGGSAWSGVTGAPASRWVVLTKGISLLTQSQGFANS